MRRCVVVVLAFVFALLSFDLAFAAKKAVTPSIPKPIYEAPMTVVIVRGWSQTCEPNCPEWIAAEGEITGATPQAFARVFKAMGRQKLPIIIRSPGGSINAAVDIGHMIRTRGLDVAVGSTYFQGCAPNDRGCKLPSEQQGIYRGSAADYGGFCFSACPLILASGKVRLASFGTQVGVHQPKTVWTQQRYTYRELYRMINGKKKIISRKIISRQPAASKVTYGYDNRLRSKLTSFYREMGVDVAILDDSNKATYQNMNQLTGQRVNELHLRTAGMGVAVLTQPSICKVAPVAVNCIAGAKATRAQPAKPEQQSKLPIGIQAGDPNMVLVVVRNHNSACEPFCPAWIAADGVVTKDTMDAFKAMMKRLGKTRLPVVFNSPGGDIDAAMGLGMMIRSEHLATVIAHTRTGTCDFRDTACIVQLPGGAHGGILEAGRCNGACLLAFAGGERRANAFDSQVLVHAAWKDDAPGQQQSSAVKLFTHFSKMGIGRDLMDRINDAKGVFESTVYTDDQSTSRLINEDNFKNIVPTPARCKDSGERAGCFRGIDVRLKP